MKNSIKAVIKSGLRLFSDRITGTLVQCDENGVSGWIACPGKPSRSYTALILVDGREVGRVRADQPQGAGGASPVPGNHGFSFDPRPYLRKDVHETIEVLGVDNFGLKSWLGRGHVGTLDLAKLDAMTPEAAAAFLANSQQRWKGTESAESLTWGRMMTGDSFIDAMLSVYRPAAGDTVIEIGPGYGRLLKTILQRGLPFRQFVGLDISQGKVTALQSQFGRDPRIGFRVCDVISGEITPKASVVLCSGTLEHFFPNAGRFLANLRRQVARPCRVFLDFKADEQFMRSMAWFEETGGAFIRTYAKDDLLRMFADCGYHVLDIREVVLGQSSQDTPITRYLVAAEVK